MTNKTGKDTTAERVALVTGGSAGLGLALTRALAEAGWRVITDGRTEEKFEDADLPEGVMVVVGDLTDADHRAELLARVTAYGRLDLLVHNASTLGPLPMRPLAEVDVPDLAHVWRTNISDRPLPVTVVPHLLALLEARPESGRYQAEDF